MSKEPKRNVYVGHRYVPKIMGEWDKAETYEGLSIVTNEGTSYTSKKRVPKGIDILNEEYWVVTGNYNAQIEEYRKDIREVEKEVNKKSDQTYVNSEIERLEQKDENLTTQLSQISINVKSIFGAVGDGVSNDTDALINALDHAKNNSIKKVYLPAGTYLVDPSKIVIPVDVTLTGSSYRDTIIMASSQSGFGVRLLTGSTVQNIFVRGFEIGIENYSYWTKIYDCKASYNKVGITFNENSYIVKCKNNEITFNGVGILVGKQTYQLIIKDNVIDNNDLGVGIHSNSVGCILSDNTIEGNRNKTTNNGCGVLISGLNMSRTLISGNWFETNGNTNKSVDVIISPYYKSNSSLNDAYAVDIYNTIIDDCVPLNYQHLFLDRGCSIGNITLKDNAHVFTKHGIIIGGAERLNVKVSDSYFKGVLNRNNIPIYLAVKNDNAVIINVDNCNAKNSDDPAIDAEMSKGVKGTIVYSWGVISTKTNMIKLNSQDLFVYATTFEDLLSKSSVIEIKARDTGAGEFIEKKGILDKKYIGSTKINNSAVELRDVTKDTIPLFEGMSTESYFIPIGDKRTVVKYQDEAGGWNPHSIDAHDVFPIIKKVPMLDGRAYVGDGEVVYLMLVINKENYDKYFKMVNYIHVYDIHTQLI